MTVLQTNFRATEMWTKSHYQLPLDFYDMPDTISWSTDKTVQTWPWNRLSSNG